MVHVLTFDDDLIVLKRQYHPHCTSPAPIRPKNAPSEYLFYKFSIREPCLHPVTHKK
jgi:hypothetical protein